MNRKYRKTIIAGNWKMNLLPSQVKPFGEKLKAGLGQQRFCQVVLCVPAVMIPAAVRAFRDCRVAVGAQDVSPWAAGAYTGEISAAQLKDAGAKYVIVGHSERRQYHGETDDMVRRKVLAALEADLTPILCVGESWDQRENGLSLDVIRYQIKAALAGLPAGRVRRVVVAYEPIWAIGTGKTASPEEAQEACREIRATIRALYDARVSRAVTIQYGGSMNAANAAELLAQPDIDGGLIGGASLDAEKLLAVIRAADQ